RLVADERVGVEGGHRRDVDDGAAGGAERGQGVLAGQPHALEVHVEAALEGGFGELGGGRVAEREAGADVVVQDVQSPEAFERGGHQPGRRVVVRDVGLERPRLAALALDHVHRGPGGRAVAIDDAYARALARQQHRRRASVADRLPRCLPAAHDDRRLALDPPGHRAPPGGKSMRPLTPTAVGLTTLAISTAVRIRMPPAHVQPPQPGYWYYCPSAGAYYPAVGSCPEPWVPVPPSGG